MTKKEIPMGISKWINLGKKFGYTGFFLEKIRNEVVGKEICDHHKQKGFCNKCGTNSALFDRDWYLRQKRNEIIEIFKKYEANNIR